MSEPSQTQSGGTTPAQHAEATDDSARQLERVASVLEPLNIRPEHLKGFGDLPGADEEPWDLLLSSTATDEYVALQALADAETGGDRKSVV